MVAPAAGNVAGVALVTAPAPPPSPRRRGLRAPGVATVLAMWAAAVLAGLSVLTDRLFVSPPADAVTPADAVIVLAGDAGDRLRGGLELVRTGTAPTLVLDGLPDSRAVAQLCQSPQPFEVVCLRPDPDSTRAEAQAAGRLAAERGWGHVVVVTSRFHVTRAGLLFRRCVPAAVTVSGTDPHYDIRTESKAVRHEWLGLLHTLLVDRGC